MKSADRRRNQRRGIFYMIFENPARERRFGNDRRNGFIDRRSRAGLRVNLMKCNKCDWRAYPGALIFCKDALTGPYFCPKCNEEFL